MTQARPTADAGLTATGCARTKAAQARPSRIETREVQACQVTVGDPAKSAEPRRQGSWLPGGGTRQPGGTRHPAGCRTAAPRRASAALSLLLALGLLPAAPHALHPGHARHAATHHLAHHLLAL